MGKINWGRVFLCGLLTGVLWGLLWALILAVVAGDFIAAVRAAVIHPFPPPGPSRVAFFALMNLVVGTWVMWLYAAIRARYGPGPKTAAVAGLAWWVIGSVALAFWAMPGFVSPAGLLALMAASMPAMVLAAVVGAWPYKE